MDSIWYEGMEMPQFPRLEQDLKTDVLIIGGGLSGLMCAWNLTKAGVACTVIEQNRIMEGVSGRTTAKISSQHGLIYQKLIQMHGPDIARMYWEANEDAISVLRSLSDSMDCEFKVQNSYIFSKGDTQKLEEESRVYEQLNIPYRWDSSLKLPFSISGALRFENQAQFHPLKFASHIAKGLHIYENTKAISFIGNKVQTPVGNITADKIIVATHFPMLNKHGAFFLKLYQQRSYVIALENTEKVDGIYLDCKENGLSLRSAGDWLLLGGGGHRTGKHGAGWEMPEDIARQYFPTGKIAARWATQDCMSLDGIPYIGKYSKSTPNLLVATGFQKWGMTTSVVAAKILTDHILERENPYASIFSPSRNILHKQLFINGLDSAWNLLRPTRPRCPHLGCALRWNSMEHSWDCPCHGSRFDESGRLLNNPATDDLKRKP